MDIKSEYIQRVNRVLDHLDAYYFEELNLEKIAEIAHFSPYHFHRVFKGVVGEPLNQYIQRVRVEKAAGFLAFQPNRSIVDIALSCGFSSQATFARVFKRHFDINATQWRKGQHTRFSKNCKTDRNDSKAEFKPEEYSEFSNQKQTWKIPMIATKLATVEIKTLPETPIAYIRHIGHFKEQTTTWRTLFHKLTRWAAARDLLHCPSTQFFTVFRDDLNITDFSKFKADVCISLKKPISPEGEVGISSISSGKYAVANFELDSHEFEAAWEWMFSEWLPKSGFQPDSRCCFERYLNDASTHPSNKHLIEICIPVIPL